MLPFVCRALQATSSTRHDARQSRDNLPLNDAGLMIGFFLTFKAEAQLKKRLAVVLTSLLSGWVEIQSLDLMHSTKVSEW